MKNEIEGRLLEKFQELFPEYDSTPSPSLMYRYLVAAKATFSGEEVVAALESGKQAELLAAARRASEIGDLLGAWNERNLSAFR